VYNASHTKKHDTAMKGKSILQTHLQREKAGG